MIRGLKNRCILFVKDTAVLIFFYSPNHGVKTLDLSRNLQVNVFDEKPKDNVIYLDFQPVVQVLCT
jgi:hypothetical protein